jgi:hypothetical protein
VKELIKDRLIITNTNESVKAIVITSQNRGYELVSTRSVKSSNLTEDDLKRFSAFTKSYYEDLLKKLQNHKEICEYLEGKKKSTQFFPMSPYLSFQYNILHCIHGTLAEPEVDVVLVHGIQAKSYENWNEGDELYWPLRLFRHEFPKYSIYKDKLPSNIDDSGRDSGEESDENDYTDRDSDNGSEQSKQPTSSKLASLIGIGNYGKKSKSPIPASALESNFPKLDSLSDNEELPKNVRVLVVNHTLNYTNREMIVDEVISNLHVALQAAGVGRRPVVFICHSLGGLIVKELLRKSKLNDGNPPAKCSIATQTKGVVFLGTPHKGAAAAQLIINLTLTHYKSDALAYLKNKQMLLNLNENFRTLNIPYLNIYESKKTPLVEGSKIIRKQIVKEKEAIIFDDATSFKARGKDHLTITKLKPEDDCYIAIWNHMRFWLKRNKLEHMPSMASDELLSTALKCPNDSKAPVASRKKKCPYAAYCCFALFL